MSDVQKEVSQLLAERREALDLLAAHYDAKPGFGFTAELIRAGEIRGVIPTAEVIDVIVGVIRARSRAVPALPLAASAAEVVAWLANDDTGRVIDLKTKVAGERAKATGSAVAIYSIPLIPLVVSDTTESS